MTSGNLPPAALLAGGLGTRIRAVAGDTPKVLLPVEGRPFLAHILDRLHAQGVPEVVLCLGHAADRVWDAARAAAPEGLRLTASREPEARGTGGAVKLALPLLGSPFFILNGDTLLDAPLAPLMKLHLRREAAITLSLVRSEHAAEKGSVRVDPQGRVLEFSEKVADGTGLVNAGVYAAGPEAFARCPAEGACSLEREVLPGLIAAGSPVAARIVEAPFIDIGLPEDYMRVRRRLRGFGGGR